jgi:hypothetical protein
MMDERRHVASKRKKEHCGGRKLAGKVTWRKQKRAAEEITRWEKI